MGYPNRLRNSYLHDLPGDIVSTTGPPSQVTDPQTRLDIVDSVIERSGPKNNNQSVTAHSGFAIYVLGGRLANGTDNVVATDNYSRIDLYGVLIEPGARNANVVIKSSASIIYGCEMRGTVYQRVRGTVENCVITTRALGYQAWVLDAMDGAIIRGNTITNDPFADHSAVRVRGRVQVIDNVFEGFNGRELLLDAGGVVTGFATNVIE